MSLRPDPYAAALEAADAVVQLSTVVGLPVGPPDPAAQTAPVLSVDARINQQVSQLAGVDDYAAVASAKPSMRNEKLKERLDNLEKLFTQLVMSLATTPALQPLQDQVDSLTTLLQALSISTSTTAVSARSVGATATTALTASGTTAINDPAGRTTTQLVLTGLLVKTNTLPAVADLSTVITITSTVGTTTTPVLTRTILLAALPAVGNVLDVLGNNGTTSNVYIPVGSTLKVSASKGNFDFTLVLGLVAPTAA